MYHRFFTSKSSSNLVERPPCLFPKRKQGKMSWTTKCPRSARQPPPSVEGDSGRRLLHKFGYVIPFSSRSAWASQRSLLHVHEGRLRLESWTSRLLRDGGIVHITSQATKSNRQCPYLPLLNEGERHRHRPINSLSLSSQPVVLSIDLSVYKHQTDNGEAYVASATGSSDSPPVSDTRHRGKEERWRR